MERTVAALLAIYMVAGCPLQAVASSLAQDRLPASIQPDSYHLKIVTHLDPTANFTFGGQVSMRFRALEDTNNITLHVQNLNVDDSRIQLKSYDGEDFSLCLEGVDMVPEQDYYIIRLSKTLRKGQMYKVKLYFSSILNEQLFGYYRSSYVDVGSNETRWLSVTHFEPTSARAAFPCLDEPSYKAKFIVWLGHHKSLTALSNMPLEKQIPLDDLDDFVWSIFEESVPMSTYIVAYTVNDFAYKESKVEGSDVVFRTWSRRDYIDQCGYAAEVGPKLLKYYEEMFGIPFPLRKIDEIAIPDLKPVAMENWGLITYKESELLLPPDVSSQVEKLDTARVMAHELAHQWFGNLVTMKWWTDLWLNEGFATYIGSLGAQNLSSQYDIYNADSLSNAMAIFRRDAKLDSQPISQRVFNRSKIRQRFSEMAYKKGSAVLRMIHMILGQDEFFEGVRDYLTKHKYDNAEQDDLWAAFTEKARKCNRIEPQYDMKTIMDSWTLQSGYPWVNVSRNYETGTIEIIQQRFLKNTTIPEEEANKCWWVPLSYTTASELDFTATSPKEWLECNESGQIVPLHLDNVTGVNEWIIFNIQLSGVYRVLYDSDNWRLIGDTLKSDQYLEIHVMNRAQIIGDVMSFAWYGYHGYDVAFYILEYLTRELEHLPWNSAIDALSKVHKKLKAFPQHQTYLNAYIRYIIEPIYNYLGGLNATVETSIMPPQSSLRHRIAEWACRAELEDCVHTALNYFRQWKLSKNPDEENKIPLDVRDNVYRTAIRHGDQDDWSFLWQRLKASNAYSEKINILNGLGCTRNETVLREYLGLIFDKESQMGKQGSARAFYGLAICENGSHIALEYLVDHIARLHNDFDVDHAIVTLSLQIVSTEERNKLQNFIGSNKEYFKDSEKSGEHSMEKINSNLHWIERNLENVKTHLETRLHAMGLLDDFVSSTMGNSD